MDSRIGNIVLQISKILSSIANRVTRLESISHPPRKFVTCEDCKQKIKESEDGKN